MIVLIAAGEYCGPQCQTLQSYHERQAQLCTPCLSNKLPASFRQPNPDHSFSHSSQPNCPKLICPIITTVIVHHSYSFPL